MRQNKTQTIARCIDHGSLGQAFVHKVHVSYIETGIFERYLSALGPLIHEDCSTNTCTKFILSFPSIGGHQTSQILEKKDQYEMITDATELLCHGRNVFTFASSPPEMELENS